MAHDYEDLHDIDDLSDDELRTLVRERLADHPALESSGIIVHATQGAVTLSGQVGTDEERRAAEHVVTDGLGVERVTNDLLVRASLRARDDGTEDDFRRAATNSLELEVSLDGVPRHLVDKVAAELEGTSDYEAVMEDGATWNPPSSPTPEGLRGTDAGPEEMGGRH